MGYIIWLICIGFITMMVTVTSIIAIIFNFLDDKENKEDN